MWMVLVARVRLRLRGARGEIRGQGRHVASAERQPAGADRAEASYAAILRLVDGEHFGAHLALAHIYVTRGQHREAVAEYRWCLEQRPSDGGALVR